jgi:fructokinase
MRIGIDLGGTKIAAIALDDGGAVRWEHRIATPRGDYAATIAAIRSLVDDADRTTGVPGSVGIGIPGAISPATRLIKNANSVWLNGRPFREDLVRALGRDVRLANDANCLAVSEATDGAGVGAAVVFAAILGTGAGGGLVVQGRLVTGANAIAGEWGHNAMPWPDDDERPGPPCYCGRSGCIETFVSGTGLAADYARRGGDPVPSEDVVARAAGGDELAGETMRAWERRLARAFASLINVIDPDVIVVGGGLSRIGRMYDAVPRLWGQWVFSDAIATRLVPARHGDASGVRGAAWLWPKRSSDSC